MFLRTPCTQQLRVVCAYTSDYIHHFFTQRNDTFLPFVLEHSLDLLLELNDLWLRLHIPTYHPFH